MIDMKAANAGKIVALKRYPEKKAAAVTEAEMIFKKNFGIVGDCHADGKERQISLLTVQEKEWMEKQKFKGFCFQKYKENILLDGIALESCKEGDIFQCADVMLEITSATKSCHPGLCKLIENGGQCILAGTCCFAKVIQSGNLRTGMEIAVKKSLQKKV